MRNFTHLFLLLISTIVFPQEKKVYFDDALTSRISNYNIKLDKAIKYNDSDRATFLFDSLFTNHLKDTYMRPLNLKKVNGGNFNSEKLDIPFIIITKSAWFVQENDEVNIINDFATKFKGQVKILILFWGDQKTCRKLAKSYNNQVTTTYIDETKNENSHLTFVFKHSFGAPSCFYFSDKKQLAFIDRTFSLTSENLTLNSLEDTTKQLALLIFKDETTDEGVITTIENSKEKPGSSSNN